MSKTLVSLSAFVLMSFSAAPSWSQPAETSSPSEWRATAERDLEAAYELLRDNHPAAVPALGDRHFVKALEQQAALARRRTSKVSDYAGYLAVLEGFATGMGDKHIWSTGKKRLDYSWPGVLVARRGGAFVVAVDQRKGESASLVGWRLARCDDKSADEIGAERIGGFHAVWSIEAQRIQNAFRLFIDTGNPFLKRPARCVFTRDGASRSVGLHWEKIEPKVLQKAAVQTLSPAAAGFGLRTLPSNTKWIGIERFADEARPVLEAVRSDLEAVRQAPIVVVDLRGNGGGDSRIGSELLEILHGAERTAASRAAPRTECPALWRASRGNIEAMASFRAARVGRQSPEAEAHYASLQQRMSDALARSEQFDRQLPKCGESATPARSSAALPASKLQGVLVVLTDNQCFSSCLLTVDEFRRSGALHLGEPTDAATRYMEVREVTLPSGLSTFSTLQKVNLDAPENIGPFTPSVAYPGDVANTATLEPWVVEIATRFGRAAHEQTR